MTAPKTHPGRTGSRGRIDKREAILEAAFQVFSRKGFASACIKEIAVEAKVAKPTIYSHLDDKDALFREAVAAASEVAAAENIAAVEGLRNPTGDLDAAFAEAARLLLASCLHARSCALKRLTYAELPRFPELLDTVRGAVTDRLVDALAGHLALLSLAGSLSVADPVTAAEQFVSLLTGPLERRTRLGTRALPQAEVDAIGTAAVRTFLAAYRKD
ncbi:TetR/AcrR family transcriptional regulator [Phytomonospora sp. NPDC050363]|uniref:TetR/AcrR family transcriptional regulator n=1 Tax=Phytomonospora sp. NPDC050363 TaxID=3155642 RepID=UPI0033CFFD4B